MRLFFESRGAVLVDQMLSRGRGERHDSLGEERRRGEVDLARCCGQELRTLVPEGLFGLRDEELHLGDSDFARDEVSTEGAEDGDVLPVVVPELGLVGGFGEFDGDCGAAVVGVDGADLAEGALVEFWSGRGGGRRGWGVEREEVVELLVQVGGWGGGHGCCCLRSWSRTDFCAGDSDGVICRERNGSHEAVVTAGELYKALAYARITRPPAVSRAMEVR